MSKEKGFEDLGCFLLSQPAHSLEQPPNFQSQLKWVLQSKGGKIQTGISCSCCTYGSTRVHLIATCYPSNIGSTQKTLGIWTFKNSSTNQCLLLLNGDLFCKWARM